MRITATIAAALLTLMPVSAVAQEWPERPITVIVPWSAGGGTDSTARALAAGLERDLGQTVNVVNQTGGGGLVGHLAIANAEPDGYTIGTVTIEIAMYRHQGLDSINHESFSQIALYNTGAIGVHVRADSPYESISDLIEAAKADPGALKASGAGRGGISHLAFAGLLATAASDSSIVPWVPSEGSAPALQQLTSGAIEVVATTLAEVQALRDAGEVRTLVLIANDRDSAYPDVPSVPEALEVEFSPLFFRGVSGPAGIPDDIVKKLSDAVGRVTESAEFKDFMNTGGFNIDYKPAPEYADFVIATDSTMKAALSAAGITE